MHGCLYDLSSRKHKINFNFSAFNKRNVKLIVCITARQQQKTHNKTFYTETIKSKFKVLYTEKRL